MKNVFLFCLGVILFAVGIILGAELNSLGNKEEQTNETKKIDSIQDIVLKNVQSNLYENNTEEDDNITPVVAIETKISPYATLTIEKFFKNCGHTTLEKVDIPKELVNMTENELQNKYVNWEIKKFNENEVHLYREIDANCSAHFVVKEQAGKVAVFAQITDKNIQLKNTTNIDFESLREEDKELLKNGVELYGEEALSSFIEDFES